VNWADSVPNLLIGLREGLEAGLVVTILLAAVRKTAAARAERDGEPALSAAPVWLGVVGAVSLAGAFAAVLTFSVSVLSSGQQEAVSGLLSVLAVCLVTGMIFWMRRTASTLASHLRGEVDRAVAIGAGALTVTAFLSAGREGLETTLFLWTAAKASGQTAGPLIGAAAGITAAAGLCWLLYRRAVRLNVGVFFNRTAFALIVIAAGVLAYGLGDLQDAGWLPGHAWVAADLTAHIDPGSWWASIVTGLTELSPRMTVLQVTAWLAYLAFVIPSFVNAGRAAAAKSAARPVAPAAPAAPAHSATTVTPATATAPAAPVAAVIVPAPPGTAAARWERTAAGSPWLVGGVLVAVPALAAGMTIAVLPAAKPGGAVAVSVTRTQCAPEWTSAAAGTQTITVANNSGLAGEIRLDNAAGGIIGEIETLGPGTSAPLTATLGAGRYTFECLMGSKPASSSQAVAVSAHAGTEASAPVAVKPVTLAMLTPPNKLYQRYASAQLADLAADVAAMGASLRAGDIARAKQHWLTAQLAWERAGASYNSFGNLGLAVDGLPDGLPDGVSDKGFTGLHRLEYGLWHGQRASELLPVAGTLAGNVATIRQNLTSGDLTGDPANLSLRAHEIIEDAVRDHLSGIDDAGAGAGYPMTYADTQADRAVLGYLSGLLNQRQPGLVATAERQLAALDAALEATRASGQWQPLAAVPLDRRQQVNAAVGGLLETLAAVPGLLEVPVTH
jgi:high-affinity iron transporter